MARRASGSLKDAAMAKAKSKAKVEDLQAWTRRTRTSARTGQGETPTLHQGGGQPLTLWRAADLGPTTQSGTQAQQEQGGKRGNEDPDETTLRNVSASCGWRKDCGKGGLNVICPAEF